jgi:3-methyladenine DNA glycosylase/8-oxoguanine DNA glycosylase
MSAFARYDASAAFLRDLDDDWAGLVAHLGPCLHDPKAAREPYEALVRAIGYQQLAAKAGDAIIARLKTLYPSIPTPPSRIAPLLPRCSEAEGGRAREDGPDEDQSYVSERSVGGVSEQHRLRI